VPFLVHPRVLLPLNIMISQVMARGGIKESKLLEGMEEYIFSQYENDITLLLLGDNKNVDKVVSLLNYFLQIFELDLNWDKNLAYLHGILHLKS